MSLASLQRLLGDLRGLDIGSLASEGRNPGGEDVIEARAGSEQEDPYHQTLRSEMTTLLERAIGELPARGREVLALYHFAELTMKEVGAVLGIGESHVSQIHTATLIRLRATMRDLLGNTTPSSVPPATTLARRPKVHRADPAVAKILSQEEIDQWHAVGRRQDALGRVVPLCHVADEIVHIVCHGREAQKSTA
jgi:Sigma-70, region 4